ncbi:MAG: hypothetical protein ACLVI9_06145 [Anaerostipes hadrus]
MECLWSKIMAAALSLYEEITNPSLSIRKLYVTANHIISNTKAKRRNSITRCLCLIFFQKTMEKAPEKEASVKEKIFKSGT